MDVVALSIQSKRNENAASPLTKKFEITKTPPKPLVLTKSLYHSKYGFSIDGCRLKIIVVIKFLYSVTEPYIQA